MPDEPDAMKLTDTEDWFPVNLTFWPSVQEIKESKATSKYSGGIEEYLQSFYDLEANLKQLGFRAGVPHGRRRETSFRESRKRARAYPETFVQFVVFVGSTGLFAALYNVLKTWADARNGRKIRIRIGHLEVEATQMTEKQFLEFLEKFKEWKRELLKDGQVPQSHQMLERDLLEAGYDIHKGDCDADIREKTDVASVARASIDQYRSRVLVKPPKRTKGTK